MAVYTEVSPLEAGALCHQLGLGTLTELMGIRSGIENTNYYASTTRGQWVLTLFERLSQSELPYYLQLMQHLAIRGVPVPAPQADAQGNVVHNVAGKPAAIVTRLPGSHRLTPQMTHAAQVGAMLAKMHVAGATFDKHQAHLRGLDWWVATTPLVLPHVSAAQAALLQNELGFQQKVAASEQGQRLPRGPIHADLFRDNVMFDDTAGLDTLCGFFDFYFAGTDALLFDVAICLNDWCLQADGVTLDDARANTFIKAYQSVRSFTPAERQLLPAMLRAAALRFWISRLWDWHLPRNAALLKPKDPAHFEHLLTERIAASWSPVF